MSHVAVLGVERVQLACMLCSFSRVLLFPPPLPPGCFSSVVDLVMWKDMKKSGAVLGGATAIYALFELSGLTLIELWATAALIITLTCTVWSLVAGYLGK